MLAFHLLPFALLSALLDVVSSEEVKRSSEAPKGFLERFLHPSSLYRRDAGIAQVSLSTDGSSYYTVISAGNISFRIALDTASSDLWLLSSGCSSNECKSVPTFPLSYHSPTFGVINENATTFNLSFADGTVSSGFVATENVQLDNFTIPNQVIGLVNSTNVTLENQISGVLGMGFPRLSLFSALASNTTPFVDGLAQRGLLNYPFFGLSLGQNVSGTLSLGAIDVDVVQNVSNIEWHKVVPFSPFGRENNSSRYLQWVLRMSEIGVNGTNLIPEPTYPNITESSLVLLDIGTNGMFGPYSDVSRMFDLMTEARLVDANVGQWALPCDTGEVLTFNFGHGNFTLQPTDYLIGPTEGDPNLCLAWPRASADSGDGIDWQLGTPFLRTVYSIFSYGINNKESPMIGLYPLNEATTISENATFISSFFASASATVATTLPNFVLSTATPAVLPYMFNTSVAAFAGDIASSDLGTSTYTPLLRASTVNASALPTITASPTLATFIITDGQGMVVTSISHAPTSTIILGKPPGSSGAISISLPSIFFTFIVGTLLVATQLA